MRVLNSENWPVWCTTPNYPSLWTNRNYSATSETANKFLSVTKKGEHVNKTTLLEGTYLKLSRKRVDTSFFLMSCVSEIWMIFPINRLLVTVGPFSSDVMRVLYTLYWKKKCNYHLWLSTCVLYRNWVNTIALVANKCACLEGFDLQLLSVLKYCICTCMVKYTCTYKHTNIITGLSLIHKDFYYFSKQTK